MKATHLALLFTVLSAVTLCQQSLYGSTGGFYVQPANTSDCALAFGYNISATDVTISQYYKFAAAQLPTDLPAGCNAKSFVFTSFFTGDTLPATDVLTPTYSTYPYISWQVNFTSQWLDMNNGTACVYLQQTSRAGLAEYLCSVSYAGVQLYFAVWGTGDFVFDQFGPSFQAWVMNRENYQSTGASSLVIGYNSSYPNVTAQLFSACGSGSNVITSLSTPVTVYNAYDLSGRFANMTLAYTLVKMNNAAAGNYLSIPSTSQMALFSGSVNGNCWSMGINYSDILPNMSYCAGGCKVSFILEDSNYNIYVLETSGITTNGTSTGTGSNTGSGSSSGSGSVIVNPGGNGGSITVSSAVSMMFNACLLIVSVVYLAW